jgi:hypothetical protein
VPARRRPAGVALLRDVVRRAVEASTLRRVAREIGVSAPGLALFIDGAVPREQSLDRYRSWFLQTSTARAGSVSKETVLLAIGVLLQSLPPNAQERTRSQLMRMLLRAHDRSRIAPPEWLRDEVADQAGGQTEGNAISPDGRST